MKAKLSEQIDNYFKEIYRFAEKHYTKERKFSLEELKKLYYEKQKTTRNSR
jgi:hypothetical protein